jgi:hypothetical protein
MLDQPQAFVLRNRIRIVLVIIILSEVPVCKVALDCVICSEGSIP